MTLISITGESSVIVNVLCDKIKSPGVVVPQFIRQEGSTFMFDLGTPLACPPQIVECQAFDAAGNKYDLAPLTKLYGEWKVVDARQNVYYFNVCKMLGVGHGAKCPGRQ